MRIQILLRQRDLSLALWHLELRLQRTALQWPMARFVRAGIRIDMVSPAGFEPTAPRLGIWCSILLSYGDMRPPYTRLRRAYKAPESPPDHPPLDGIRRIVVPGGGGVAGRERATHQRLIRRIQTAGPRPQVTPPLRLGPRPADGGGDE